MLFLAKFILKGKSQAALVAASMAIFGLMVPPAAWISAAAIVLVTLVYGEKSGLLTTALSSLGAAIFSYLIFATPQVAIIFILLVWLPAWLMAMILRQTVSLAYTLQVLTGISLLAVVLIYMLFPNFGEFWREPLDRMIAELAQQSEQFSLAQLKQTQDWIIAFLPGLFAGSIMFGTILSLLLGRWWQAVFYNPGGFAEEFQGLNLGKMSALAAALIISIAMLANSIFAIAMVTIVFVLYGVQALSLLHAVIKLRQLNVSWLVTIYIVMLFFPQFLLILILASLIDPWLDIRQRLTKNDTN